MSYYQNTINITSMGMGEWAYHMLDPMIQRALPSTKITHNQDQKTDLIIKSHFYTTQIVKTIPHDIPYINWSGESYPVYNNINDIQPIIDINTIHTSSENNFYIPHLVNECKSISRYNSQNPIYCCSYANTVPVYERDKLFGLLRKKEKTCYSFGKCLHTHDNPFELDRQNRNKNAEAFSCFGFNIAMENKIVSGYLTEKIGYAFNSGSVPIYWGDSITVNEFFNPESFINVNDYVSLEKASETILEIWNDKQKLEKYKTAPITVNNKLNDYLAIYTEYKPWQKKFIDTIRQTFPNLN